ncbi:MAG: hypothetical protein ACKO26_27485 [Planctomycetota bacterium]
MTSPDPDAKSKAERISAWIDGELSEDAKDRFGEEMGKDPSLRLEADLTKAAWDLLNHLPKPEPNPSLTQKTMTLLQFGELGVASNTSAKKAGQSAIVMIGLWWTGLAMLLLGSFFATRAMTGIHSRTTDAQEPFFWLDTASVRPEIRSDTEFLKWLAAPDRFGSPEP